MNSTVVATSRANDRTENHPRCIALRACCWAVALALGAAQAWATRFTMNPDGISYLDIGDAYWKHDWHNAINAYWSPLYSWILGSFTNVIRPSLYWEYPLVHLINFLIYIGALGCFEYLLTTITAAVGQRRANRGVFEFLVRFLAYNLFITASLALNGLHLVTPDLALAGLIYVASALLIRIHTTQCTWQTYTWLGLVLGMAFFAKAVMFPVGFVYVATAFVAGGPNRASLKKTCITALVFLTMSATFIAPLSVKQGHITFSSVGPIAYEVFVDGVDQFIPRSPALVHPVHELLGSPRVYEYPEPIHSTYPLWFDSSYWHEGLRPYFSLSGEKAALTHGVLTYIYTTCVPDLALAVVIATMLLIDVKDRKKYADYTPWPIVVPGVFALMLYLAVYTEPRYVAPFLCLLWLVLAMRIRVGDSALWRSAIAGIVAVVLMATCYFVRSVELYAGLAGTGIPVYQEAAEKLSSVGVGPGTKLFVISSDVSGKGGASVARLNRARIVAETPNDDLSWMSNRSRCAAFLSTIRVLEVHTVLLYGNPPPSSLLPWTQIGSTGYYLYHSARD